MPIYRLQGPDGRVYRLEGPENAPDAELIAALEGHLAEEARIAAIKEETTALGRGFSRGIDVAGQGFGSALEGVGRTLGIEGLEEYGAEMVAENEAQLAEQEAMATRLGDVEGVGTGLDFFLETLGETAPLTGTSLASGAIAGGVAGSAFGPVGTIAGGIIGAAASQLPFFYGFNRERQKEAIDKGLQTEISEGAAFLTAIPQATLDAIAERFMVGKFLTPKAIQAGGLFTRAAKGGTAGVISEVPTEIGQTILERAQAGLPLADEEAIDEYTEVGITAGIVGGTLGGGAAALRGRAEEDTEGAPEGGPDITGEGEVQTDLFEGVEGADLAEFEGTATAREAGAEAEAEVDTETDAALEAEIAAIEEGRAVGTADMFTSLMEGARPRADIPQAIEYTPPPADVDPEFVRRVAELQQEDVRRVRQEIQQAQINETEKQELLSTFDATVQEVNKRAQQDAELVGPEATARAQQQVGDLFVEETLEYGRGAEPPAEAAPDRPKEVTKKFLNDLGIAPKSNLRKQIEKKKLTDPQIREVLTKHANLKSTPNVVKTNINQFLGTTPEEGRYAQVLQTGQLAFNFRAKPTTRQATPAQGEEDVSARVVEQEPSGAGVPDTGPIAEGAPRQVSDAVTPVSTEGTATPTVRGLGDFRQRTGTAAFGTTGPGGTLDKFMATRAARKALEAEKATEAAKKATEVAAAAKRKKVAEEKAKQEASAKRAADKKKKEAARKKEAADIQGQDSAAVAREERKRLIEEEYQKKAKLSPPENEAQKKKLRSDATKAVTERLRAERDDSLFNVQYNPELDEALNTDTVAMLKEGDLKGALEAVAKTTKDTTLSRHAKNLVKYIGDTRIVVVPSNPSDAVGRLYRDKLDEQPNSTGMFLFDDQIAELNNVIVLDSKLGLTPANLLHEMTHAATHAVLKNKSNPITKQLNAIFETVRETMSDVYGYTNLDEFVAEAYSNPAFQQKLATVRLKGDVVTLWQKVKNVLGNFIRMIQGKDMVAVNTVPADTTVNRMIDDILAPWAGSRGAGTLYNRVSMGRAKEFLNDAIMSIPAFDKTSEATLKERLLGSFPKSAKRFALSMLDLNAIVTMSSERIPGAKDLLDIIRKQSGEVNTMLDKAEALYKEVGEWTSNNQEKANKLTRLMGKSTLLRVDPSLSKDEAKKKYVQKDKNGKVIDDEKFKIWESMQSDWGAITDQGRTFYKRWRTAYRTMYDEIVKVLDTRLQADGVDAKARKTVINELYRKMIDNGVIDPYFPLMRQGKVWLEYNAVDPETGNVEYYLEAFETRAERTRAIRQIKDHWANPESQYKSVIDAQIEAASRNPNNKGKSKEKVLDSLSKISQFSDISKASYRNAPPASFVNDILKTLDANGVKGDTQEEVMRLYLDALPERSFAQSFRNRKDVRGFLGDVTATGRELPAGDMFKAYRDRAYNISHQVARVKYGAEINAFQSMLAKERDSVKESRGERPEEERDLTLLYIDELEQRAQWAANPVVQNWAKVATGLGFNATLGLNLSSALVNLSQLPMVTLPYLGGEYGFIEATKAVGNASKLFMASGRVRNVDSYGVEVGKDIQSKQGAFYSLDNYDFNDPNLPPEIKRYKTLVEIASKLGQLNRSIAYDILDLGDLTNPMAKVNAVTGFFFHHGERMNRQISMAAAYDLELNRIKAKKGKLDQADMEQAAIKAINTTEMTNGGIAAASAPRFAQDGLGKVVFLFKRYASAMYFMLGNLAYRSIRGSGDDKKMAIRQLAGVFGGAGLVAGVQGLPLFGVLAMAHDIAKDDDDEDFETSVRKYFGEGFYGGLGNYLFGVDVASRMGLSNLVFRDRLIEKDQSILWTTAEMLGGPVVGTALQVERGFGQIADGNVARGVETAMPAAIRNVMKSGRFATEGATTLRGDPIVEDIGPWNIIAQAVGFAPADYTLQLQKNAQVKKIDRAVNEERTKLLKKYYIALRNADSNTLKDVYKDMVDFNKRHPVVAITPKTIKRSMKQHMRTTATMYHGITISPKRQQEALDFVSEYDETPNIWYDIAD
jgi:hypothetical protein